MALTPARWRRLHISTRIAAVLGAAVTLLFLAPVAAAVVMLRCCDDSRGPTAGAWAVMALILIVGATASSVMCALAVAASHHLWLRSRRP